MYLTKEEERMLSGEEGEGTRKAMELLVTLGDVFDAECMVPIKMAFLVKGPSPLRPGRLEQWLRDLGDQGAKFRCPTYAAQSVQNVLLNDEFHTKMGAIVSPGGVSGHPRNAFVLPLFGQNIVADGTAVVTYMNTFIGARANTLDPAGTYASAICGRTPKFGFLLPENRRGKVLVNVTAKLENETDWSALGYYVSRYLGIRYWDVPVFHGINVEAATHDEFVTFCSALPAYGAIVHCLIVGLSPEARTLEEAFGGEKPKETITVGQDELKWVYDLFSPTSKKPDLIMIGGFGVDAPIETVHKIANMLKGKKVAQDIVVTVELNPVVRAAAEASGLTETLRAAGVKIGWQEVVRELAEKKGLKPEEFSFSIVNGAKRLGFNTLVFTDAKMCHYIGNQEVEAILLPPEKCVEVALKGSLEV